MKVDVLMKSRLIKSMTTVFVANVINLLIGLITNFVIPKYLKVETYAAIKTYQFYIGYVGVLHLGFIDAMYLQYGGGEIQKIDAAEVANQMMLLRVFQAIMAGFFIIISLLTCDIILLFFSLSILPLNMTAYLQLFYQATGEFKIYGRIINATSFLSLAVNILLVFGLKMQKEVFFLTGYVLIFGLIWVSLELIIRKVRIDHHHRAKFSIRALVEKIKNGLLLMLGNFALILLLGIDRWLIRIFLDYHAFAYYSFAVSIVSLLDVVTTAISITLYNYLCKIHSNERVRIIQRYVLLFSVGIVTVMFPAKLFVEHFLPNYIESNKVLVFLFAAQIFFIHTKSIYTNLYKAQKRQRKYFSNLLMIIVVSIIISGIGLIIYKQKEILAVAALVSSIILWLVCSFDFNSIKLKGREFAFLLTETAVFILCGMFLNALIGFAVYGGITLLFGGMLFRRDILDLLRIFAGVLGKWYHRRQITTQGSDQSKYL